MPSFLENVGPYAYWAAPARLWMNVERANRQFNIHQYNLLG